MGASEASTLDHIPPCCARAAAFLPALPARSFPLGRCPRTTDTMYAVCHHSTTRMRASTGVRTTVTKGGHRCPQVSKQTRVRSLSLRLLAHASSLFLCSHHHKHETDGKHGEEHNANAQHCRSPAGPLHLGPAPSCGCMRDFSHRCARGLACVVRMFKDMSAVSPSRSRCLLC